jgi:tetratricopeptide (TPR) repeat protein
MNTVFYLLARVRFALVALLAIYWTSDHLKAHEGPEHEIEELTEQIAKGETSDLYLQRAIEYRVLGKNAEAARDLEHAARLDSASLLVQRELGRVYFALGKTNEAIDILSHALKTKTEQPTELAALRVLRAEFLGARRENKKALEDCEAALRLQLSNVEWYLLRSDLQRRLNQKKERITGLEQGIKETGAGILHTEWIEALLDDRQFQAALPHIERELAASRIQSSWRLRRARALLGLGNSNGAKSDLDAALLEMKPRVAAKVADVTLLTEYAQALDLAGESEEARLQYERARDAGADDWVKDRIKTLKAEEEERAKKTANP